MPRLLPHIERYEKAFGHSPPPSLIKAFAQGQIEEREITSKIEEALRLGRPVREWAEYKPMPRSLEEALLRELESGTPTPSSSRSPSSED